MDHVRQMHPSPGSGHAKPIISRSGVAFLPADDRTLLMCPWAGFSYKFAYISLEKHNFKTLDPKEDNRRKKNDILISS